MAANDYLIHENRSKRPTTEKYFKLQRYQTRVYNFLERPSFANINKDRWKLYAVLYQSLR